MERLKYIKKLVNEFYNVDIDKKIRLNQIVAARQISHYLARKYTNHSLSVIGYELGCKNHASVLYGIRVVKDILSYDIKLRNDLKYLENRIDFLKYKSITIQHNGYKIIYHQKNLDSCIK